MKRSTLILLALVVVVGVAGWFYFRPGEDRLAIDLIKEFPTAMERRPNPDVFEVIDATINGETKRAIFTKETTRIKWKITVPDNAWLRVSLGLKEEAWTAQNGDGVRFSLFMSDGQGSLDTLQDITLNPAANPNDRKWNDLLIDLTQYAGESMELIFKTNASSGNANNQIGDLALIGAPRIVVR